MATQLNGLNFKHWFSLVIVLAPQLMYLGEKRSSGKTGGSNFTTGALLEGHTRDRRTAPPHLTAESGDTQSCPGFLQRLWSDIKRYYRHLLESRLARNLIEAVRQNPKWDTQAQKAILTHAVQ